MGNIWLFLVLWVGGIFEFWAGVCYNEERVFEGDGMMDFWASGVLWNRELAAGLEQKDLIPLIKEFGLAGFEVRPFWGADPLAEARELAELARAAGLGLTYAGVEPILGSSLERTVEQLRAMNQSIEIASILGSPVLRVNVDGQADWSLLENQAIVEAWGHLIEWARLKGVQLVLENPPDRRAGSIEKIGLLLAVVPTLQLTFDTGNWVIAGEHPVAAWEAFSDRIGYLHLKDVRFLGSGDFSHCRPGMGGIDFHGLLEKIYESYEGPAVLEFASQEAPDVEIRKALTYLQG